MLTDIWEIPEDSSISLSPSFTSANREKSISLEAQSGRSQKCLHPFCRAVPLCSWAWATILPLFSSHLLSPFIPHPPSRHLCCLLPPYHLKFSWFSQAVGTVQRRGAANQRWQRWGSGKKQQEGGEGAQRAKEQKRSGGERGRERNRDRRERDSQGDGEGGKKCNKSLRQTQTGRECALHRMREAECAAWHRNMSWEASNRFATGTIQQLHHAHEGRIQRIHVRECECLGKSLKLQPILSHSREMTGIVIINRRHHQHIHYFKRFGG